MYSNIDGIKTDGKEFTWYLVGLGGTALFGILHLMCVADLIDRKRSRRKMNRQNGERGIVYVL